MNVKELEVALKRANVPERAYSIMKSRLPNEQMCLIKEDQWYVYYSERGDRTGLRSFQKEEDACQYFYDILKSFV